MASSPFLPLPDGLDIEEVSVEEEGLMVSVVARASSSACPLCSHPATRIHSRYLRTLADVPCGGRRVVLSLLVRKFFCLEASCRRRIFTERLPQLVQPWARLTNRLCQWQERIGFATNGEVGARLAPGLGMQLAPTTLLRRLMAHPIEHPQAVLRLGIDDFAFRRGKKYGTILVDLDTHRVIDLLEDRTAQGAAAWLSTHPEIEVISRDRGTDYAAAARQAAPQALQVADRFHIVKNLVESVEVVLARCRAELRKAYHLPPPLPGEAVVSEKESISSPPQVWRRVPAPHIERVQRARRAQRMDRYEQLMQLRASGLAPKEIAQQMGLSQRTMRRWLAQGTFPEARQRRKKRSPFDVYAPYVIKRWQEGCHNGLQLWRELQMQGYHHAPNMLYQFLKTLRAGELPVLAQGEAGLDAIPKKTAMITLANVAPSPLADFLARKAVWLFVRDPASLDENEQQELELICQGSATANTTYQLAQEFVHMVRHQRGHDLPLWLSKVAQSQIPELQSFASGIERDKDAVLAGLTLPFSNGVVEGHVHRLKLIKRMMYGRAAFPLLRQRVLHCA